eukprot:1143211-Pelagomonas_calceolata.AAC.2
MQAWLPKAQSSEAQKRHRSKDLQNTPTRLAGIISTPAQCSLSIDTCTNSFATGSVVMLRFYDSSPITCCVSMANSSTDSTPLKHDLFCLELWAGLQSSASVTPHLSSAVSQWQTAAQTARH